MLFADLSIANRIAFHTCVVDELSGKKAFRPLECATGAVIFQRLTLTPTVGKIIDARLYLNWVILL